MDHHLVGLELLVEVKVSASRASDLCSVPAFTVDLFPG